MQRGWVQQVLDNGYLVTPYGMRFFWPNTVFRSDGTTNNQSDIFNYPVQGLATGEIIPIALVHLWYRSAGTSILIVNTIHDSIVCEIDESDIDIYKEIALQSMTFDVYSFLREVYNYDLKVNLGSGVKISKNWGEGKEIKYNVTPEGSVTTTAK